MSEEITVYTEDTDTLNTLPWVTVPMETPADKLRVFALTSNPDLLKDVDGKVLNVIGWIVERGERVDRNTGNNSYCINTVFFTDDGKAFFTQSNGVARAMHRLRSIFPDGPQGVLKIKSVKQQMKNGNEVRTIIPVFED